MTERKPKVTIVDDDRDTREMLTLALELEGFEAQGAGAPALDRLDLTVPRGLRKGIEPPLS